jgi:hypothetical protein
MDCRIFSHHHENETEIRSEQGPFRLSPHLTLNRARSAHANEA